MVLHGLRVLVLGAALGAALSAAPARATSVEPMTFEQLSARSDVVASIVVRSASSAWVGRRIVTFYEVDVAETWASTDAARPRTLLVAMPGGIVGGIGQRVPGAPVLEVGARYVVCLGDDNGPRSARGIMGFWQGVWRIEESGLVPFGHDGPAAAPSLSLDTLRASLAPPGGAR